MPKNTPTGPVRAGAVVRAVRNAGRSVRRPGRRAAGRRGVVQGRCFLRAAQHKKGPSGVDRPFHRTPRKPEGLPAAAVLARLAEPLLALLAARFGGLDEGHVLAVEAENAAAVHRTLETAQGTVDGLVVANFDADGHSKSGLKVEPPRPSSTPGLGREPANIRPAPRPGQPSAGEDWPVRARHGAPRIVCPAWIRAPLPWSRAPPAAYLSACPATLLLP